MELEDLEMIVKFDEVIVDGELTKIWSAFQKSDGNPCLGISPSMSEAMNYCAERVMENKDG